MSPPLCTSPLPALSTWASLLCSEVRRCLPAEVSVTPGGGGGAFLLQASVFDSVRWTKKALEICAVGVFGIAVAAQGLSQQLLGFPGTGPGR